MDTPGEPQLPRTGQVTYEVQAWGQDDRWIVKVVDASPATVANRTPINCVTQAKSVSAVASAARELIALVLDADKDCFTLEVQYILPEALAGPLASAKLARQALDVAQAQWHERATDAARALTSEGYSLRETATLLGLSHQRIGQLLQGRDLGE